jgi:hypothetical protein
VRFACAAANLVIRGKIIPLIHLANKLQNGRDAAYLANGFIGEILLASYVTSG